MPSPGDDSSDYDLERLDDDNENLLTTL